MLMFLAGALCGACLGTVAMGICYSGSALKRTR